MATGWASPSKENLNFARLCRLLIDGGTRVLRHVFDTIHSPSTLHTVLHSTPVYSLLRHLRAKRVLRVHQWDELYPITTRVTSGSFDITMLVVLLRNICSLTPPPTRWDKPPAASDLSKEADLARINLYRNEVYGHITQTAVSDADFEKIWTKISAVLIRLFGSHYQPDIDRLKVREIDLEEEKYLIKMLEEWEETEKGIKTAIKESKQRVMGKLKGIKGKLGAAIKGKAAVGDTASNVQSLKDQPGEEDNLSSRAQGFVKKRKLPDKEKTSNGVWTLIAGLLGRKKDEKLMDQLIEKIKPQHNNGVRNKLLILNCLYEYRDDELSKRVINELHEYFFVVDGIYFAVVNDIDCLAIRYLLHIAKLLNDEHTGKHPTSTQSFIVKRFGIGYSSLSPSGVSVLCKSLVDIPAVTELKLCYCGLDDECVKIIAQTLSYTRITHLNLINNNEITDEGVMYLCTVISKSDCLIKGIDLSGNDKISHQYQRSVQILIKQNKPDAKIQSDTRRMGINIYKGLIGTSLSRARFADIGGFDSHRASLPTRSRSTSKFLNFDEDVESEYYGYGLKPFLRGISSVRVTPADSYSDSDADYFESLRLDRGQRTESAHSRFESQSLDIEPSLTLSSRLPVDSAIPVQALPEPDSKPVESTSTVRGLMKEFPTTTSTSDQQTVTLDFEGGFHDLSPLGVLLEVPPNSVTCPANVTCRKLNPDYSPAPATDDETLVSYIIEFTPTSLQKRIIVTLKHCGPSKKEGYETLVKALKHRKIPKEWEQIEQIEIPVDSSFMHQHYKSGYIQVKVSQLTTLAVVSRIIRDTFKVIEAGCVVRSSVCDDVTLEFPVGAVDQTFYGTMKLYCIPDHTEILDGITAFPCPLIVIDGFEGITFNLPVKIRLPHPYPAGYPSGAVRVLCMEAPHEWKDMTDQVHCIEHESFLELEVKHFTGYWVWIAVLTVGYTTLQVAPSLSQHLFKHPQYVCFAVFKENNPPDAASLRMALLCVPNIFSEQFNSKDPLKGRYNKVAENTSSKSMRPDDKAYIKVGGCYKIEEEEEEDIFLQFIENDVCKKEPLLRKNNEEEKLSKGEGKMTISFLKRKDGEDKENLLCKFCIDEVQLHREVTTEETVQLEPASTEPSVNAVRQELVSSIGVQDLLTIDATTAADKVADYLQLNKLSMADPPDDVKQKCQAFCLQLKKLKRDDIIKELRNTLPSGMTGPILDDNTLYQDLDFRTKRDLTRELCGDDLWKCLASELGVPRGHLGYYGRHRNPAEVMLEEKSKKLTVGKLYDKLVLCGAAALADTYL